MNNEEKSVKELVSRIQVENSPFTIIGTEKGHFLTLGKYRMTTKNFSNVQEITEWMDLNKWELMATFCSIIAEETTKEVLNNLKQIKNE